MTLLAKRKIRAGAGEGRRASDNEKEFGSEKLFLERGGLQQSFPAGCIHR